jgi:preprotein translocase subunit YajC
MNAAHTLDALLAPLAAGAGGQGSMIMLLMPIVLLVMLVMMSRSQSKRRRERLNMLMGLKKGDRVSTTGGMIGVIDNVRDNDVTIRLDGDGVKIKFRKSGVAYLLQDDDQS